MGRMARACVLLCLALAAGAASASEPTPVTIDLLVYYTPAVRDRYGSGLDTRLNHLVNVANDTYARSESGVRIRIVHTEEVAYSDSAASDDALDDLTFGRGVFADTETQRRDVGADLVVLMRLYVGDGVCGIAWIGGLDTDGDFSHSDRYGYSHVSIDCDDHVLPHELGHNMGLTHSRRQSGEGGTYPWALGHGEDRTFATVMAYASAFDAPQVPLFSSPRLTCNGRPCGVDRSDSENGADAAYTLRHVRGQIADYRETVVTSPPAPSADDPRAVAWIGPDPVPLHPGDPVVLGWTSGSDVASVELSYRVEKKEKDGHWKKSKWRVLTRGGSDDTLDWTVADPRTSRKRRLRFRLRGYDEMEALLGSRVSPAYHLPRRS